MLKHVTEKDFEKEVLDNEKPVLVDFFATWCGPCKMIGPVLEKIGNEHDDFDIAKIDVDQSNDLALKAGVQSIPTMCVFLNGEEVERMVGFMTEDQILEKMKKYTERDA